MIAEIILLINVFDLYEEKLKIFNNDLQSTDLNTAELILEYKKEIFLHKENSSFPYILKDNNQNSEN